MLVAKVREKMLRQRKFKTVVRLSLSVKREREIEKRETERVLRSLEKNLRKRSLLVIFNDLERNISPCGFNSLTFPIKER